MNRKPRDPNAELRAMVNQMLAAAKQAVAAADAVDRRLKLLEERVAKLEQANARP